MSRWGEEHTRAVRETLPPLQPSELVHLNNAGCSVPSVTTLRAVQDYLNRSVAGLSCSCCSAGASTGGTSHYLQADVLALVHSLAFLPARLPDYSHT